MKRICRYILMYALVLMPACGGSDQVIKYEVSQPHKDKEEFNKLLGLNENKDSVFVRKKAALKRDTLRNSISYVNNLVDSLQDVVFELEETIRLMRSQAGIQAIVIDSLRAELALRDGYPQKKALSLNDKDSKMSAVNDSKKTNVDLTKSSSGFWDKFNAGAALM